jgi:hypothetical protein
VSLEWARAWVAGATTLLARVPSIVVPEEFNVLVNPAHAAIRDVRAARHRRWNYDPRFGRR